MTDAPDCAVVQIEVTEVGGKTVTKLLTALWLGPDQDWSGNDRKLMTVMTELEALSLAALAHAAGWDDQSAAET